MNEWVIVIIALIFSAFFSGMEIAFISSNKLVIELDKKKGIISGKILSFFSARQSGFIATMLVGNNIALVIYGIMMAKILEPLLINALPTFLARGSVLLTIQTIISTILILFTAEYLPKSLFRINPNNTTKLLALPAFIMYIILYPIVKIIMFISEFFWRYIFRIKLVNEEPVFCSIDLYHYLNEFKPEKKEEKSMDPEVKMFKNAIELSGIKIRECMIPRTEIEAIDKNSAIDTLREKFYATGLSKIPIHEGSVDDVIGYVHSFDMFKNPTSINEILRPIEIVPGTMLANKLLDNFIKEKKNIAVVVDEFGGTSGLVTLEDLVEEIFGEIQDEYDIEELTEERKNEKEFILSARHKIDYLNEKYNLDLPESEDYETIGGLIFHHYESIPANREEISINNYVFTILQVTKTRIMKVKMTIKE
jgi:CBS domain containing-hemolysin-like protein